MSTYDLLPGEDAVAFFRRVYPELRRRTGAAFWLARRMGRRFSHVAGECREPVPGPRRVSLGGNWVLFLAGGTSRETENILLEKLRPVFQRHFSRE